MAVVDKKVPSGCCHHIVKRKGVEDRSGWLIGTEVIRRMRCRCFATNANFFLVTPRRHPGRREMNGSFPCREFLVSCRIARVIRSPVSLISRIVKFGFFSRNFSCTFFFHVLISYYNCKISRRLFFFDRKSHAIFSRENKIPKNNCCSVIFV